MSERIYARGLFGRTMHGGSWQDAIDRELLALQKSNKALADQNTRLQNRARQLQDALERARLPVPEADTP